MGRHVPDKILASPEREASTGALGHPRAPPLADKPEEDIAQAKAHEGDLLEEEHEAYDDDQRHKSPEARPSLQVHPLAAWVAHRAHHEPGDHDHEERQDQGHPVELLVGVAELEEEEDERGDGH